jgi:hypothetical protein
MSQLWAKSTLALVPPEAEDINDFMTTYLVVQNHLKIGTLRTSNNEQPTTNHITEQHG